LNNLNSLQGTIADLKEIVQRNQGSDHEAAKLVYQMEQTLADIERKTRKNSITFEVVVQPSVQTAPII
jgi:hypothetical protein